MAFEHKLTGAIVIMLALLAIGTLFYHYQESWSYVDSLYFSVTTLTTIGYGELYPTHDTSKIFTIIYVLIGVPMALFILVDLLGKLTEKRLVNLGATIYKACGKEIKGKKR